MKLKASEQVDGSWVSLQIPADPGALDRMLSANDGREVVVVDEDTKKYYCGSRKLIDAYQGKGLDADSFYPLAKQLWESAGSPLASFQGQPHYCTSMSVLCSAKLPSHLDPTPCRSCAAM